MRGRTLKFIDFIVENGKLFAVYVDKKGRHVWVPKKRG